LNKQYSVILVIPCYNEEKRLDLTSYNEFLMSNPDFFILFVNDGSSDKTKTILNPPGLSAGNFSLIELEKNSGKGEAVRRGVNHCLSDFEIEYIGFADADLSTPLQEFLHFKAEMKKDPDINIVLGSRVQMLGKNIKRNLFRHWFSRIIATAICKVIDEPVYDTQCGAKLFTRNTASQLFSEKFISKWLFDVELLSRYKQKFGSEQFKRTIIEYPVKNWTEKPNSKMRYHYIFRIIPDLVRIKKHYFRKK